MSPDSQLLSAVVLWVIGREVISVNLIQHNFKIGWYKATELVKQLEDMGLVGRPVSKLPRHVTPISFEDIPADMLGFLQRNGITDDAVKLAISARDSKTTELATRQPYEVGRHPVEKTPAATQDFLRDNGPGVEHTKTRLTVPPNHKSYACRRGLPPKNSIKCWSGLEATETRGKSFDRYTLIIYDRVQIVKKIWNRNGGYFQYQITSFTGGESKCKILKKLKL